MFSESNIRLTPEVSKEHETENILFFLKKTFNLIYFRRKNFHEQKVSRFSRILAQFRKVYVFKNSQISNSRKFMLAKKIFFLDSQKFMFAKKNLKKFFFKI